MGKLTGMCLLGKEPLSFSGASSDESGDTSGGVGGGGGAGGVGVRLTSGQSDQREGYLQNSSHSIKLSLEKRRFYSQS
jgi:hypothetical protein